RLPCQLSSLIATQASAGLGSWLIQAACLAEVAADRRRRLLSNVLLLTAGRDSAAEILPSLTLLSHPVRIAPPAPAVVMVDAAGLAPPGMAVSGSQSGKADSAVPDIVLVDARRELVRVKDLLREIGGAGLPVLAVISEGAWAAVSADWGAHDVIL